MKRLYQEAKWHEILYVLILNGLNTSVHVLLYMNGMLQELDMGQWAILGWITIMSMMATAIIIWNVHSRLEEKENKAEL